MFVRKFWKNIPAEKKDLMGNKLIKKSLGSENFSLLNYFSLSRFTPEL